MLDHDTFTEITLSVLEGSGDRHLAIRDYTPTIIVPSTRTLEGLDGLPPGALGRQLLLEAFTDLAARVPDAFLGVRHAGAVYTLHRHQPDDGPATETWQRIVVAEEGYAVERCAAPPWWGDPARAATPVPDIRGPGRFAGHGWALQLPQGWSGEYGDDVDELALDGHPGVLRISTYHPEGPVDRDDVARAAATQLEGADAAPVQLGSFSGHTGRLASDDDARAWIVSDGVTLLVITWSTEPDAPEDPGVHALLATLHTAARIDG